MIAKKSKIFLATYPISILLFFGLLFGFSLFLQASAGESEEEFRKMKLVAEYRQKMDKLNQENLNQVENSHSQNNLNSQIKNNQSQKVSQNHSNLNQNFSTSTIRNEGYGLGEFDTPSKLEQSTQSAIFRDSEVERLIYQPTLQNNSTSLFLESPHSAIILDVDSGSVLYSKNSTEHRSIASLTKMVTAMIVIDRVRNLDEEVVIPASVLSIEGTKVGCLTSTICRYEQLYAGERVTVRDLLRSMLMLSANDAATALALHISGSEEEFAKLMNARMKELGITNTHFCRPSGLELDENEEACYSTAYDISRVMAHLLRYEKYKTVIEIMQTKESEFTNLDGSLTHTLQSTNRILGEFPNIVAGKTGFTPRAGYSLAMATESPDKKHKIVSIVLDDYHRFDDVQEMSNWAFANYEWK
jgi:D-alanyl-D-alanine carboxypeptidase